MMYEPNGFCWSCGKVVDKGLVYCDKHTHTKPKPERKGHYSGASKHREETGEWQIHKE